MPYAKKKQGNLWVVINKATGKVLGKPKSEAAANAQLAALAINVKEKSKKKRK